MLNVVNVDMVGYFKKFVLVIVYFDGKGNVFGFIINEIMWVINGEI